MKTLIIAPFLDGTGYGKAAEAVAEALSLVTDVSCFPLKLNNSDYQPSEKVQELLKATFEPDAILQICTPNFMVGPGIGWWFQESKNQGKLAGWRRNLSYMTEWYSGPFYDNPKARQMFVPTNLDKYKKEYPQPLKPTDAFRFYYIGDVSRRKNVEGLIKAYVIAFNKQNVELVLKVPPQHVQVAQKIAQEVVGASRLNPNFVGRILIEGRNLTDDEIYGLHQQCDCFITMARGEGWCLPAVDAAGFEKPLMLPSYMGDIGAFTDYQAIDCIESPCWLSDSMPKVYNSEETWWEPSPIDAAKSMRAIYHNRINKMEHKSMKLLSYDTLGPQILEAIKDAKSNS